MRAMMLILLLSGCASTEVTLGVGPRRDNVTGEYRAVLSLEVMRRVGERWRCGWAHDSAIAHGSPQRDDRELVLDGPMCDVTWGGRR